MKIYIDILFFVNCIMDFLLLNMTADIMSLKISFRRSGFAAMLGGVLGVIVFMKDFNTLLSLLVLFCEEIIIILAAFFPRRISELLKLAGMMFFCTAIFSGVISVYVLNFDRGIIKNGIFYMKSSKIIFIATIVYFGTKFFVSRLKKRVSGKTSVVVLEYGGRRVKLSGFIDTGNGLKDPISGKPVIIIDLKTLRRLVGAECNINNLCEWVDAKRIKIIPYHTIDQKGYLTGIVLDKVHINGICREKVIAAVCESKLKYSVILHAGL